MSALTTVNISASPTLLYGSQGSQASPLTIINTDSTNTIWVGNASNITVAGTNTIPLAPGDSFTSDGSVSLYGVTNGPVVSVAVTPGGNSYSPGTLAISGPVTAEISGPVSVEGTVDVAGTVAISGTPVVDVGSVSGSVDIASVAGNVNVTGTGGYIAAGTQNVMTAFAAGTTLAAGADATSGILDMTNNTSFNLYAYSSTASQTTAGAAYTMQVVLEWYADSGATMPLALETFWIWCVNGTAAALPAFISGPCQGAYLTVTLTNPGSTGVMTVGECLVFGNNISIPSVKAVQAAPTTAQFGAQSGVHYISPGGSNGTDGILTSLIGESALAASTSYCIPCPVYIGPVAAYAITTGSVAMTAQPSLYYVTGYTNGQLGTGPNKQMIWTPNGDTSADTYSAQNLIQPRSPLIWTFETGATAPTDLTLTLIGAPV